MDFVGRNLGLVEQPKLFSHAGVAAILQVRLKKLRVNSLELFLTANC